MTNPIYSYNGKLIREMSDQELVLAYFFMSQREGYTREQLDTFRALEAQILLRMSHNLSDDLGHCQHCGETYCLSCAKPFGADENFCSRDCRDEEMPKREISRAEGMSIERARAANVD